MRVKPSGPEFVPGWDVYRDSDGNPVTITWNQIAAIRHAISVVEAVRRAEGCGPLVTDDRCQADANISKSRLLGRMLVYGLPPTKTKPPRYLGGPEWSLLPGGDPFDPLRRIAIDPNVRVRHNLTYAGFEDVAGGHAEDVRPGEHVHVVEPESGLEGPAVVDSVDAGRRLIFLRVEWELLRTAREGT